jgi:serine/threonine-protein kinase SRPK3
MPGPTVRHSTIAFPSLARLTYAASDHKHVTLKIGTPKALEGELRVLRLLRTIKTNHSGSLLVRRMLDDFQVDSKNGVFQCVVHPPLAISVKAFRRMLPDRALPVSLVKLVIKHLLLALDFLHTEAKVIHTGESNRIQGRTQAFYPSRLSIAAHT